MIAAPVHLQCVDSTNSEILRRVKRGIMEDGACIYSDYQTNGRGRLKRQWTSARGKNLLASWWLVLDVPFEEIQGFSLVSALAVIDWLKTLNIQAGVKWPNDIRWGGRKLGGILMEVVPGRGKARGVITGVGINLCVAPGLCGAMLQPVSVAEIAGSAPCPESAATEIGLFLLRRRERWMAGERQKQLNEWLTHCDHLHKKIAIGINPGTKVEALTRGIGPAGQLLADIDGHGQEIWADDIFPAGREE